MRAYLESFRLLSEKDIEASLAIARPRTLEKGALFIQAGKRCDEIAFIKSGSFRSFYLTEDGEETTYCINFPNTFITAYSSYILNQPTRENIQALSKAEIFVLHKNDIEKMANNSLTWTKFLKTMAEYQYIELENRIFLLQNSSAQKRYDDLLEKHPLFVEEIPLGHLASYLGITQRHLSRLRKNITV